MKITNIDELRPHLRPLSEIILAPTRDEAAAVARALIETYRKTKGRK